MIRRLLETRWLWTLAALAWMGVIFWSSHKTWSGAPKGFPGMGNLLHFPIFAALALAWSLALGAWSASGLGAAGKGALIATLYGISDEWHQSFVPGRQTSWFDVATDALGAVFVLLFFAWRAGKVSTACAACAVTALAAGVAFTCLSRFAL